jgi:hypothetical protein
MSVSIRGVSCSESAVKTVMSFEEVRRQAEGMVGRKSWYREMQRWALASR